MLRGCRPCVPARAQTSGTVQPRKTSLHAPAVGAQAGAVTGATEGNVGGADLVAVDVMVVAPVGEQRVRFAAGPANPAADRWDRVEQRKQLRDVVVVASGEDGCKRGAVPVGDPVVFRAGPASVDRRGPVWIPLLAP